MFVLYQEVSESDDWEDTLTPFQRWKKEIVARTMEDRLLGQQIVIQDLQETLKTERAEVERLERLIEKTRA